MLYTNGNCVTSLSVSFQVPDLNITILVLNRYISIKVSKTPAFEEMGRANVELGKLLKILLLLIPLSNLLYFVNAMRSTVLEILKRR